MLMIRLRQGGAKSFRIVVSDKYAPRQGKHLEVIGLYNPITKQSRINQERVEFWQSKGAQLSDTVKQILKKEKMTPAQKEKKAAKRTSFRAKRAKKEAKAAE